MGKYFITFTGNIVKGLLNVKSYNNYRGSCLVYYQAACSPCLLIKTAGPFKKSSWLALLLLTQIGQDVGGGTLRS